jgi:hypothetical protein
MLLPKRTSPTVTTAFGLAAFGRVILGFIGGDHGGGSAAGQSWCGKALAAAALGLHQPALFHRRLDEGGEQRMRREWAGFQFGV